jgi:hypothetical protein
MRRVRLTWFDGHRRWQPFVLHAERRREGMQRGLDEVGHRELRQRAAHRDVRVK